jgi:hypothetical protein
MMIEKLIECPRCGSNACSEMSDDKITIWLCMGCGFTTNTFMTPENAVKAEEVIPNLYVDLKFIDDKGLTWYPNSVTLENKSMVFADGTSKDDWKWAAVKSVEIAEKDRDKFKGEEYRADMTTIKHFEEKDFMDALEYIGYFGKK